MKTPFVRRNWFSVFRVNFTLPLCILCVFEISIHVVVAHACPVATRSMLLFRRGTCYILHSMWLNSGEQELRFGSQRSCIEKCETGPPCQWRRVRSSSAFVPQVVIAPCEGLYNPRYVCFYPKDWWDLCRHNLIRNHRRVLKFATVPRMWFKSFLSRCKTVGSLIHKIRAECCFACAL